MTETMNPPVPLKEARRIVGASYIARPIGAVIFGHFGDRVGRKKTLIATVLMMGLATGLIGVLPSFAAIGVGAPILLVVLRFLQGISVGGEWGGAMLLTLESTPKEKRGFYASIPQLGSPTGTLLSSGIFALVSLLPDASFMAWGWRVPFLAAFVLLAVALYLRLRVEESPAFQRLVSERDAKEKRESVPVLAALRYTWGRMIVGVCAAFLGVGGFFLLTTFIISYGTKTLGLPKSTMLNATLVSAVVEIVVLFVAGKAADRFGAWRVCAFGAAATIVLAFPVFLLVDTKQTALVFLGIALGTGAMSIPYAPIGALVTQMFPVQYRYSAVALSYNIAGVFSGFVPLAAESLTGAAGGASWGAALLLMIIAAITLAGSLASHAAGVRRKAPADVAQAVA
jgi:predicted MFS family arabinose efflux permease